jgi:uncharacterized protein (UPF0332 family)
LQAKKHGGAQAAFNREFVHTGLLDRERCRVYLELLKRRLEVDYEEYADATESEVLEWLPKAEHFVAAVEAIVAGLISQESDVSSDGV